MRTIILFVLAVLTVQKGLAVTEAEFTAKVFGGAENLATIKNAPRVTACLLTPKGEARRPDTWKSKELEDPSTYTEGPRVDVSATQLSQLRAILLDRTLDDPDSAKPCIPIFHVRFTFAAQNASVDVNVCFLCDILYVSRVGKIVGWEDFDPAHKKLLGLCQTLFPDDKDLAGLTKGQ